MKTKFKIDDVVSIRQSKVKGVVIESTRYFKETNSVTGDFINEGHAILEDTLNQFQVPFELIGDTLIVDMPEGYYGKQFVPRRLQHYKAQNIAYTVDVPRFGYAVFMQDELA
jgi:hypothetical protein